MVRRINGAWRHLVVTPVCVVVLYLSLPLSLCPNMSHWHSDLVPVVAVAVVMDSSVRGSLYIGCGFARRVGWWKCMWRHWQGHACTCTC